ncbi:MAG: hypothetical protein WDZ72_02545 [Cyclobacteriaceae bacterium]
MAAPSGTPSSVPLAAPYAAMYPRNPGDRFDVAIPMMTRSV